MKFPPALLGFLLLAAPLPLQAAEPAAPARPNILFVIADDWGCGHAGAYGCPWIKTPNFDRIAKDGILFKNAYTPTAKCTPSRSCIMTGRNPWQLGAAANHYCVFPPEIAVFPEALEAAGYSYATTGKVWAPGTALTAAGQPRNMAGRIYSKKTRKAGTPAISNNDYSANFERFLAETKPDQPWFFWCGFHEPHRPYQLGSGVKTGGKKISDIDRVPAYWPDTEAVRNDMLDYAYEVESFDRHLGVMLDSLAQRGLLDSTLIIVTSDNGMPFPRVKGNTYENANHLPLAVRWPAGIRGNGRTSLDYVSFTDFAPTFLEAAKVDWKNTPLQAAAGKSLFDVFQAASDAPHNPARDHVLIGRERNDVGRPNDEGYPVRGIVKNQMLYLENLEPSRWPACNPETGYLDTDSGPTKTTILAEHRLQSSSATWAACFGLRPAIEFYDLTKDSDCLVNLASAPAHQAHAAALKAQLFGELKAMGDPRVLGRGAEFDRYPTANEKGRGFYERHMKGEESDAVRREPTDFEPQR